LTEAFCIAIVEAASCGLLVVSTRVGGVSEVLPDGFALLAEPTTQDLANKIDKAIAIHKEVDHFKQHQIIKECYSWFDVAARTEKVYERVENEQPLPFMERVKRFYGCGSIAGKVFSLVVAVGFLVWQFYEWIQPAEDIDIAPDFPYYKYNERQMGGQKDVLELPITK